jgi:DNA polymerase III subunit gamma/tau
MVDAAVSTAPAVRTGTPAPSEDLPVPERTGRDAQAQAREQIRSTRRGESAARPAADDRDADAHPDDAELDSAGESHTELLARQLGARVIAEEES